MDKEIIKDIKICLLNYLKNIFLITEENYEYIIKKLSIDKTT